MDLNRATIIGTLGRDPETRTMQNGTNVCTLSVATGEKWTDKGTGEKKDRTEWHRVVLFGALADLAQKLLAKGSRVFIEGKIQTRKWTDQSGVEKYSTEIVAQGFDGKMILLRGGKDAEPGQSYAAPAGGDDLDSEIPF